MAEGRAGQHTAEAAEERTERGTAGGGEEAPRDHEPAQEVRRGRLTHCELTNVWIHVCTYNTSQKFGQTYSFKSFFIFIL